MEKEMSMLSAAIMALEYYSSKKDLDVSEVIKYVLSKTKEKKSSIYIIASANEIIRLRKENMQKNDKQIIQLFTDNLKSFKKTLD
jgi:Mg/Co/Ni transporter MgtE